MYVLKYLIFGPILIKIFLLMAIASIFVLVAIFLNTNNKINVYNAYADEFEKAFWSGIVLEDFFEQNKQSFYHPIASIFVFGMNEWNESKPKLGNKNTAEIILERLKLAIGIGKSRVKEMMDDYKKIFSIFNISMPIASLLFLAFLISDIFFEIGKDGKFEIDKIAMYLGASILVCMIGFFSTAMSFLGLYFINNKSEKFILRAENFGSDLYMTLSKELQQKISSSSFANEPEDSESYEEEDSEDDSDEDNEEDEEEKEIKELSSDNKSDSSLNDDI